jgi:DNA-binding MarR family transcriptional regulator
MNKTAELVRIWADFEMSYPDAGIDDFCRHYLASGKKKQNSENFFDGEAPPRKDIILIKLIDRLARMHMIYVDLVLKNLKLNHFEEFNLLSAIGSLKNPRKTEVIYHAITELSTGLQLLSGLLKQGLITEKDDPEDGRSKRLSLTPKGGKLLQACYVQFSKIPELMLMEMPEEDVEICIQLLKNVHAKFSGLWQQHKTKSFDEVYQSVRRKNK